MPPVTLVIPVYNEAAGLEGMGSRLQGALRRLPSGSEVILVDDGSSDGSGPALQALARAGAVRVLRHPRNRGYGAALKTGAEAARCDWIAITDADGTYPLGALPKLLAAVEDGADMAVGARRLGDQPALRRPAKAFLNAFASYLAGVRIPDINSGLRVFRRADALSLVGLLPDGFSFTSTITMALLGDGARVDYIPIPYRRRTGRSKIRPVRDLGGFLLLLARMALLFNPLKVFGPASLAMFGVGLLLLAARAFLPHPVGVATTIVLIVGGIQLFALGLLADVVNRRAAHPRGAGRRGRD